MDFISAVKTLPDSGYISSLQPGETWICFCFSRRFNNKRLVAKNISVTNGWSRVLEVLLPQALTDCKFSPRCTFVNKKVVGLLT
jgi:hypothetical protein